MAKKKDIRNTKEYRDWRKEVLELHGDACVLCGSKLLINVHHILPKKIYRKYVLDIRNGIPLCHKCHRSVHLKGYDFSRFLTDPHMLKVFLAYQDAMTNPDGSYHGFDINQCISLKRKAHRTPKFASKSKTLHTIPT